MHTESQVISKKRVSDYGEVYTSSREVKAMLDLVKQETERIDSRFLEPACGSGNFLAEVFDRKLKVVKDRYSKSQLEYERYAVIAASSIYGIDILEDNVLECRERLFSIFSSEYLDLYSSSYKDECLDTVKFLLKKNIIFGDALDFKNPETKKPIIFSEWSAVNGSMIKRRDYMLKFLVEKTYQLKLFNDQGSTTAIDEPVKDFPLVHFLRLADAEN